MNAKELILAKINATADFADAWTFLISTGRTPEEISKIMMSPIFSVVQKYSHSNLFSTIGLTNSKKTAIEFTLGLKQLSGINLRDLKLIVGAYRGKGLTWDNKCFIDKLLYETENGEIKLDSTGNPIRRQVKLVDDKYLSSEDGIFVQGSEVRKNMFELFSDPNNANSTIISKILLEHIDYLRKHSSDYNVNSDDSDYDPSIEDDYNEIENYENDYQDQEYDLENDELNDEINNQVNNSDFGSDIKIKVTLNSLNNIRRYVSKCIIPKNEQIAKINEQDPEAITTLTDFYNNVLPAVEEQTILGAMLGVNQGLKSKLSDFIGVLKRVENFVNARIPRDQNGPIYEAFNIIKFLEDDEYRQDWIQNYASMKSYNNILRTISEVPNFASMYKQNALTDRLESHAARKKINIKLEKAILEYNRRGSSATRKLTGDEWSVMDKYTRDLILTNWLLTQNISFTIPSNQDFYDNGNLVYIKDDIDDNGNVIHDHSDARKINLNTFSGQASFIRYFENTLFDILKQRYANDEDKKAFLNNVVASPDFSSVYNQKTHHLKLSINSMLADKNQGLKTIYSEILKAFNNLSTEKIPELNNMTFGDALFIYNSLVYKNAFTEKGFTRLFESLIFDENSIINSYVSFLSDLDSNTIDTGSANDLDSDLEINDNGTFTWGMIRGNINDFLRRLAFNQVSANKFGVSLNKDSEKSISELAFQDMFGRPTKNEYGMDKPSIYIGVSNANDWTSEMPCMTQDFEDATFSYGENYNQSNCYRWNSEVVIRTVIDTLADRLNLTFGDNSDSDIVLFDSNKLPSWAEYNNGVESPISYKSFSDYMRVMRSSAFINNGKIFINTNKMNVDTTVHELMHIFCANLKFNKNEDIVKLYYDAIDAANNLYKTKMRKEYVEMREQYNGDYGSDFKEELLVKLMSDQFTHSFKNSFGSQKWVDDIKSEIVNTINQIFASNVKEDINVKKLGDTRLADFLQAFNSKLFDTDGNNLLANMQLDQEMKTIKRILINNAEDPTKNSKIEYNC